MTGGDRPPTADRALGPDAGAVEPPRRSIGGVTSPDDRSSDLSVARAVIDELVRLAAMEIPGVVRVGGPGRAGGALVGRRSVRLSVDGRRVDRPAVDRRSPGSPARAAHPQVREAVAAAIERLVGLEPGEIVVIVDGVGA